MRIAIKAAIRIIIIYIFVRTLIALINQIGSVVQYSRASFDDSGIVYSIAILVGAAIIGFLVLAFLWIKTDWIVEKTAGEIPESEISITTSNGDLIYVAMRILGIVLLVYSIPTLIGLIGYHLSFPMEIMDIAPDRQANEIKNFLITGVQILIGLWLTFGIKGPVKTPDRLQDKDHMTGSEEDTPR